jgi:hypothetical protein
MAGLGTVIVSRDNERLKLVRKLHDQPRRGKVVDRLTATLGAP